MILIRADANEFIGSGHVMRCKSIASALADKGEEVAFITADHRGDSLIGGFPSFCLNSDWLNMNDELIQLEEIIRVKKPSLILVDSYKVTLTATRLLRNILTRFTVSRKRHILMTSTRDYGTLTF